MGENTKKEITIQIFSNSLGEEEIEALKPVFKSRWIGEGNETKLFEKELGEKIGCERTLITNCCTSSLFMSMKILGIGKGDEVILPSINFIGVANAIMEVGAKPVFADVDSVYFNILPEEIKRLRNEKTKAVFVLHYGGHSCDMDKILEASKGLYVIEDNANSPFSKYKGKNCGTLGDIGCFSFDAMKILSTGNGGAITIKDASLLEKAKQYRYFGLRNKQSGIDSLKENIQRWWEIDLGTTSNRNVSCDILSSIGRVQLKKVDGFIKRRKEIWERYQRELSQLDWLETPPEPLAETESSYYMYWIKIKNNQRDKLAQHLVNNGIYCTFRYYPLHLIEHYNANVKLPNSEKINEIALNIPLHQNLSENDVSKIIETIKSFPAEQKREDLTKIVKELSEKEIDMIMQTMKIKGIPKRKMLIDLIRVPDPTSIDDNLDEPLGLLYLAAVLRNAGYNVRITNLAGHNAESWKADIKEADLYGIQLFTPTSIHGINIAKFIKENFPNKPVICGGAHPTAVPNDSRLEIFDKIVVGEGEKVIVEVVNAFRDGKQNEIPRLIRGEAIQNLDELPLPAWDLVDMMSFHRKFEGERCFNILGSRGCCYQCAFCDRSLFGNRVRFRSVDNIVNEIKEIIKRYNVRYFDFIDDMFTVSKERVREFYEKTKGLNIKYRCFGRADVHDKEVYKLLKDSGCIMICYGIESGNQTMLDRMKKGTTVEQNMKAIKIAQEAGISVTGFFIAGFPGETKETIQDSIRFVEESGIDHAQFYTFVPLPGNEVAKDPEKYGIIRMSKDWNQYFHVTGKEGLGGKTVDTKWLTAEELEEEVRKIRAFLKQRTTKGPVQDYYKKLGYHVEDKEKQE